MLNMIASADGAVEIGGTSERLGSPADQAVFSAVRASADWILAGAETVRVERYGLPRPSAAARRARRAAGLLERPRLAVVSASMDLDVDLPLLSERRSSEERALIITGNGAPNARIEQLASVAEVVRLPTAHPDVAEIVAELARRGGDVILSEGGPCFNAQLADADLIDELCLSVAPLIARGASARIVDGALRAEPLQLVLDHLLEGDDTLFARYLRATRTQNLADR